MARSDGCVIINTHLNDKEAVDELDRLTKKIDALNEKISDKKQEQMPLVEQSKQIAANLDAAKAQLDQMRNGDGFYTTGAIKEQEQTVKALQKEWDSVQSQVERMDTSIARDTRSLERMTNRAGDLNIQIMAAKENTNGISLAAQAASKQMDKFFSRIKALARRVLVFSLITKALTTLRSYMWSAIQTNDKAVEAVAKLKGALRTLAQPIVNVVVPAFTVLVNVITRVVKAISALVSMFFGTTVEESAKAAESLYEESDALDKTGKSAKKASNCINKYSCCLAVNSVCIALLNTFFARSKASSFVLAVSFRYSCNDPTSSLFRYGKAESIISPVSFLIVIFANFTDLSYFAAELIQSIQLRIVCRSPRLQQFDLVADDLCRLLVLDGHFPQLHLNPSFPKLRWLINYCTSAMLAL